MNRTWYLIANSSTARVYSKDRESGELVVVKEFAHPESREARKEFTRDRPGNKSHGGGQGSFVEPADPKKHEADRFAREIVHDLEVERTANNFERLVVVAASSFARRVTKLLPPQVKDTLSTVIEKDYTKDSKKQLAEHLKRHIVLSA